MDMKEKDPTNDLLEFFDVIRQVLEAEVAAPKASEHEVFSKQCKELGQSLWVFMAEMEAVGFTNKQAFALLQSLVIEGVHKNG